jgi:hypothetical protein
MSEYRTGDTKLREQQELVKAARATSSSKHTVWKIIGVAVVAVAATTLITSLHDIRRYIRISRM